MHAEERERTILNLLQEHGFLALHGLDRRLDVSPATIRRDMDRLESEGRIVRVRGGARLANPAPGNGTAGRPEAAALRGVPFDQNVALHAGAKAAIGRAAAALCRPGEAVIIDGGTTTLQMCPHLEALNLQVLTNSLHIARALLPQAGTRISLPAGAIFREQSIILSPFEDDGMGRYHATKMFMGAAAIGRGGLMQADVILVHAERKLLDRADELVVLVDSSKFEAPAGHLVCGFDEIDTIVTDDGISPAARAMVEAAGVTLVVVPAAP
jgi:DeoR family ulaG and ulaABCDEF operon transcriptional repressor